MRVAVLLWTVCLMLAAGRGEQAVQRRQEPFVPVAAIYRSERSRDAARAAADLEAIRELGFTSVRVPLEWAASEPARGTYDFAALNETLALAGQQGLRVSVRLDVSPLPSWLLRRHPDGRFVPESKSGTAGPARACLDHPGVRADVEAYVAAATANAARHAAWQAIDLGSDLPDGFCRCPHTERRFREWLTAARGPEPRQPSSAASDRAAFVALQRADHLALLTAAASARGTHSASSSARAPSILRHLVGESPGQDDWLMSTIVDRYGSAVPPETGSATLLAASRLALALDGLRSAARDKGWLMTDALPAARASDLRLMTWAALSRGARGVTFGEWRGSAAGALARVIGRNPALLRSAPPAPVENRDRLRSPTAGPGLARARRRLSRVLRAEHRGRFHPPRRNRRRHGGPLSAGVCRLARDSSRGCGRRAEGAMSRQGGRSSRARRRRRAINCSCRLLHAPASVLTCASRAPRVSSKPDSWSHRRC